MREGGAALYFDQAGADRRGRDGALAGAAAAGGELADRPGRRRRLHALQEADGPRLALPVSAPMTTAGC